MRRPGADDRRGPRPPRSDDVMAPTPGPVLPDLPGSSHLAPRVTGRQLLAGVGLALALSAAGVLGVRWLAGLLAPSWARSDGLVVLQVAWVYLAVIVALVLAVGGPTRVADTLALRRPTTGDLGRATAAFLAVAAVCAVVYPLLSLLGGRAIGLTMVQLVAAGSDLARLPTATPLILGLILLRVALLGGIGEELLFRGALYGWLRSHLPAGAAIAITTAVFTVEHGYRPILWPLVVALGLAAGWIRHDTGTTTATIPLHIATDLGLLVAAWMLT